MQDPIPNPRPVASLVAIAVLALFCFACPADAKPAVPLPHFDPRSYGAKADGVTFDTEAIQKAIDACAGTGGSVVLGPGRFLTKPLELRGRMVLHLEKGAVLLGSPDIADYPVKLPDKFPITELCRSLLYAEKADGLTISGEGVLDGNSPAMNIGEDIRKVGNEKRRPSLLRVFRSGHVIVKGITLRNPCMWTQIYSECDHLLVDGLTVDAPPHCANLSGIELCDSKDVIIRNCNIAAEDDGICIKTFLPGGSENILIENNTVHSYKANGIKFGTGTVGPITHVVIRKNKVTYAKYAGLVIASVDGSQVKEVVVEDLEMRNVGQPIFIRLGSRMGKGGTWQQAADRPVGSIDGVTITRLHAYGTNPENGPACVISGIPNARIQNVCIKDSSIEMPGGLNGIPRMPPEKEDAYPQSNMFWNTPGYAFFVRHADGIVLENVALSNLAPDKRPWLSQVNAEVQTIGCKDSGLVPNAVAPKAKEVGMR